MIVVHIVEALGGGVYTYFKDLCDHFSKNNEIKTIVIYSSKRKEVDFNNLELTTSNNLELVNLDMERNLNPIKDFKSILQLRKILKKYNPDIIHLHSSKAGVIGRIASFKLTNNKSLFYTPHGYSFLSKEFSDRKKNIFFKIEKYIQKFFGGITIACGDTEYDYAKNIGKSKLVRNGVSINKITNFKKDYNNNKLTIGILGRISVQKNPKLFNDIAEKFPQYNFVWIGDGELNSLITAKNITVTGWTTNLKQVMDNLNQIDIYIQTSLWEGLPIALLEAMVLEKPIVATNIIGNKDIVVNNETGFLFNNIEELDSIFKKLEDKDFRLLLGKNGYNRCNELFNSTKNFNYLQEIYKNSLASK